MSVFRKISSAVSSATASLTGTPGPAPPGHHNPERAREYTQLAGILDKDHVPVSHADCAGCAEPCADDANKTGSGTISEMGNAWDGQTYSEYVTEKYGDLGMLPSSMDVDWTSDLAGSGGPPTGRVVVISTAKSNWPRDHYDDPDTLSHQLHEYMQTVPSRKEPKREGKAKQPSTYVLPSQFPTPSEPMTHDVTTAPSLYSSSMISQSDDHEDQMAVVFPDWKVCLEVENSLAGAKGLYDGALAGNLGRGGRVLQNGGADVERRRSWVLPYRAIVLLCSHKNRDKRCHIAAGLLRPALRAVLEKNGISVDETGASLSHLEGPPLEEVAGTANEREAEVGRRIEEIPGVHGGEGGEVGVFDINHLGGHRFAGVMLILFPSGAYLSYGRVTPQEIARVVEETILQGKIVPGLLRSGAAITRTGAAAKQCGILGW